MDRGYGGLGLERHQRRNARARPKCLCVFPATQLLKHYVATRMVERCMAGLVLVANAAAQRASCGREFLLKYKANASTVTTEASCLIVVAHVKGTFRIERLEVTTVVEAYAAWTGAARRHGHLLDPATTPVSIDGLPNRSLLQLLITTVPRGHELIAAGTLGRSLSVDPVMATQAHVGCLSPLIPLTEAEFAAATARCSKMCAGC